MINFILASKSKYRKQLLARLGISFECMDSKLNEDILKQKIQDPKELTRALSYEKARLIFQKHPDSCIIGSDQVAQVNGQILGKAKELDKAFTQLKLLNGTFHELITSYAILYQDKKIIKTNTTKLFMKKLTDLQLKNYLSLDNPVDCAGSYKLELSGISLFEKIETSDHTAIVGLPLLELASDIRSLGQLIPPEQ